MSRHILAESVFRLKTIEQIESVREAFHNRPKLVDKVSGFLRMAVYTSKNDPYEFRLLTYWESERDFQNWFRCHQFQDSHSLIPKGLQLDPGSAEVKIFDFLGD